MSKLTNLLHEEAEVIVAIPGPGRPGMVEVSHNGGTETYMAYADKRYEEGATVLVVELLPARAVRVGDHFLFEPGSPVDNRDLIDILMDLDNKN